MREINIHYCYTDLGSIPLTEFSKQNHFNSYDGEPWKQVLSWDYRAVIYHSNWEMAGSGKSSFSSDLKEKAFVTAFTGKLKY